MDDQAARELVARVERLLSDADDEALELVSAVVALYGEGLARIAALADGTREALAADELVSHLLLLHDLHPVPVEERVRAALAGQAELLAVEDGVARIRGDGCGRRDAIEEAVARAAPDVDRVEFAGEPEPLLVLPQVGR